MCIKVKNLILFSLLLFTSSIVEAQYRRHDDYGGLAGGIFGGMTMSQINGDGYKGYDKYAYTAGGTLFLPLQNVDLPFPGTLAMNMEVAFTQMGAYGDVPKGSVLAQKINLNYAQVPFQLFYYNGTRKSNIGMGFSFGYIGWQNIEVDKGMGFEQYDVQLYKKFDLGFVITPNIHLYKGLFLSPRYFHSLVNVAKSPGLIGNANQFNNSLSIRLMYLFPSDRR